MLVVAALAACTAPSASGGDPAAPDHAPRLLPMPRPGLARGEAAAISGSTLAYQTYSMFPTMNPEIKTLRGPKLVRTPTPFDPKCKREMADQGWSPAHFPKTQVRPDAFGATKAGTLIAIGSPACGEEPNGVAEVWEPNSTTSRIVALPAGGKDRRGVYEASIVRGAGDNDAFLLYGDVLRFDGKTFTVMPQPERPLERLAVAAGGTLYGIIPAVGKFDTKLGKTLVEAEAQLVRFDGRAWARVPLPHPPAAIAATNDGTLWVSSAKTLLRSRKAPDEKSKVAVAADAGGGATSGNHPAAKGRAQGATSAGAPLPAEPCRALRLYQGHAR
jgi:hypothetical protein